MQRKPPPQEPGALGGGYLSPTEGYVPARRAPEHAASAARPVAPQAEDLRNHPLHRVYRKRIRWVRMRWFTSGLTLGILIGIFLTLLASALVVSTIPEVSNVFSGEPDVAVVIGEGYLNREAERRIASGFDTGVGALKITGLNMDISPANRMDLRPTFEVNALFTSFTISPQVRNQLNVENGKVVINMVGDPQLGDLTVPLDLLPFNLKDEIRNAVNRVNNELLIAEINQSLQSGFGGTEFFVEGVTTNNSGMTIRMRQP